MYHSFTKSEDGVVAVLFGIAALPAMVLAGGAVDHSTALSNKTKLQGIVDGAALAAAQDVFVRDREDPAIAERFVMANVETVNLTSLLEDPDVTVTFGQEEVTVAAEVDVGNAFLGLVGLPHTTVSVTSTASIGIDDVEIVLALDMSGSMGNFGKAGLMRDAAREFSQKLFEARTGRQELAIGGVPWNTAINIGGRTSWLAGYDADDFEDGDSWNGCIVVRDREFGRNRPPSMKKFTPFNTVDFNGWASNAEFCSVPEVMPLSDDEDEVDRWLANLTTVGGDTITSLGAVWAHNMLSPDWSSSWSADIAEWDKSLKYVVLLTDGMNNLRKWADDDYYPSSYGAFTDIFGEGVTTHPLYGGDNFHEAISDHTVDQCTAMKDKGVTVFTIQFAVPDAQKPYTQALLGNCASDADAYIEIDDPNDLDTAFDKIRRRISTPRLLH